MIDMRALTTRALSPGWVLLSDPWLSGDPWLSWGPNASWVLKITLMDDVHLSTARHFRYELRLGGKFSSAIWSAGGVPRITKITLRCKAIRGRGRILRVGARLLGQNKGPCDAWLY